MALGWYITKWGDCTVVDGLHAVGAGVAVAHVGFPHLLGLVIAQRLHTCTEQYAVELAAVSADTPDI